MREFFRGWKRKTGVLTLLLACVFAAGWLRSDTQQDEITVTAFSLVNSFVSNSGNLSWWRWHDPKATWFFEWDTRRNGNHHATETQKFDALLNCELQSKRRQFANRTATVLIIYFDRDQPATRVEKPKPATDRPTVHNTPYWSIVIPLTILSAWLLLSKPKQPKPIKPANATPEQP